VENEMYACSTLLLLSPPLLSKAMEFSLMASQSIGAAAAAVVVADVDVDVDVEILQASKPTALAMVVYVWRPPLSAGSARRNQPWCSEECWREKRRAICACECVSSCQSPVKTSWRPSFSLAAEQRADSTRLSLVSRRTTISR
jgi:hypothetical protein